MNSLKAKIFTSFCINLFFAFTVLIFGPYEIFISNKGDFIFTFLDFWWMMAVIGSLYVIVATFFLALLPYSLSRQIYTLIFAFTICCYIQAMFLNGKMQVLIGQRVKWNTTTIIFNVLIWIGIFVAILVISYFAKQYWEKILYLLSLALVAIQMTALISLLLTTDALTEKKNGYLSQDGMFELSGEENVIVFILDYFDGRTMNAILTDDPHFLDPLDGFTYFPNATSVHSRTYPSITYLLSGNMCYFDKRPISYVNDAFANSTFIPELCKNEVDVGLYTFSQYVGASVNGMIHNYISEKQPLKFGETVKSLINMTLYRDMPYLAKPYFEYESSAINGLVVDEESLQQSQNSLLASPYKNFDDEWFYETLKETNITIGNEKRVFRFYHLGSCHLNLSNQLPYGIRSFEIVYTFLDRMRELGIYKDSTIIITTDHGYSGGGEGYMPHETAVPLLIAKPSGASESEIRTLNAPVSHTDFIPTVLNGFSLDYSRYGRTFFDVAEGEKRKRYYYHSALYNDEIGEFALREYEVDGDARDKSCYHFTGNSWDIQFSENKVAD